MARKVNQRTLDLLWQAEGEGDKLANGNYIAYCDRNATPANPYYDKNAGGLWTIGPGVTGPKVTKGTIMTKSQVEALMNAELQKVGAYIEAHCTVKLTDNQYGALCDFGYNLGAGSLSGIINLINAGKNDEAMQLLLQFKYGTENGHKQVLRGLVTRRYNEKELFEWEEGNDLKAVSVPLQRADQAQLGLAGGGLGFGWLWSNFTQVQEAAKDHVGLIMLITMGVAFTGVYLFKRYFHIEFNNGNYVPAGTKPVDPIVMPEDAQ